MLMSKFVEFTLTKAFIHAALITSSVSSFHSTDTRFVKKFSLDVTVQNCLVSRSRLLRRLEDGRSMSMSVESDLVYFAVDFIHLYYVSSNFSLLKCRYADCC